MHQQSSQHKQKQKGLRPGRLLFQERKKRRTRFIVQSEWKKVHYHLHRLSSAFLLLIFCVSELAAKCQELYPSFACSVICLCFLSCHKLVSFLPFSHTSVFDPLFNLLSQLTQPQISTHQNPHHHQTRNQFSSCWNFVSFISVPFLFPVKIFQPLSMSTVGYLTCFTFLSLLSLFLISFTSHNKQLHLHSACPTLFLSFSLSRSSALISALSMIVFCSIYSSLYLLMLYFLTFNSSFVALVYIIKIRFTDYLSLFMSLKNHLQLIQRKHSSVITSSQFLNLSLAAKINIIIDHLNPFEPKPFPKSLNTFFTIWKLTFSGVKIPMSLCLVFILNSFYSQGMVSLIVCLWYYSWCFFIHFLNHNLISLYLVYISSIDTSNFTIGFLILFLSKSLDLSFNKNPDAPKVLARPLVEYCCTQWLCLLASKLVQYKLLDKLFNFMEILCKKKGRLGWSFEKMILATNISMG
ncbi:hypothetical protein VP01_310g4 [Puccinia sorghi]|uniref:Uncharacterized protein n=1 Tax=Puccinia sorghi TaxID=27349 RepID=A0A0L6UZC1_9BASI|nr:hypothetical protein VP01_310g4 [Puccinia sorghi]